MGWIQISLQVFGSVVALAIAGFSLVAAIAARTVADFSLAIAVRSTELASRNGERAVRGAEAVRIAAKVVSLESQESTIATRPWIGVSNIEFRKVHNPAMFPEGVLTIMYHNTGSLPAQALELDLSLYPAEEHEFADWDKTPIDGTCVLGGVLPNEPTDRHIPLPTEPRYRVWKENNLKIAFTGCIRYNSGSNQYRTSFDGRLSFAPGETSPVSWNNTDMA
ncbi:MAG: hypothetical protein IIB15_08375 [Chloroflexi bacterium]|nr:hypothetical protein [Chloroflexota bacterium]